MSALNRFHETASDALEKISAALPAGAKLCLAIYTPDKPELDIVLQDKGLDLNEVVSTLRRRGLSIDGDNAYKRDLRDSIVGTLAFGAQDRCPPPAGHWAQLFWDMGRESAANTGALISALELVTDCLSKALTGGEVSAARAGNALKTAAELLAQQSR
ncbi:MULTISPECIES: hypothetical protein [Pseudomonas]|uniref:hypothetical protein n=1 Tax=Pseudomonas TaxID=286 RepID=UPI00107118DE|nr:MULTISPECIES: hypothetical protein [Pseudomonas]QBR32863.1 hypothetical protein E3Z29_21200 [Pseudomonas sp. S150]UZT91046.1 hypothetical protein OPS05_18195 [Pseudomonas koreensis]